MPSVTLAWFGVDAIWKSKPVSGSLKWSGPDRDAVHSSGTKTDFTAKSWLLVAQSPTDFHVSRNSAAEAGRSATRVTGAPFVPTAGLSPFMIKQVAITKR